MPVFMDLTGRIFGRLRVIGVAGKTGEPYPKYLWKCACGCGGEIITQGRYLVKGKTWHCHQCLQTRGSHLSSTPEHGAWCSMKERCLCETHPAYGNYGGRGIAIHEAWVTDFTAFLGHVGFRPSPDHSLDRIDNERGYEPGNVRWATRKEQCNNRRVNRRLACNGEDLTLAEWSDKIGVNQSTISERLTAGWSLERTLTTNPRKARLLEYEGVSLTVDQWAARLNITSEGLAYRIRKGWPADKIFTPKETLK